jgi:hypothetical protein
MAITKQERKDAEQLGHHLREAGCMYPEYNSFAMSFELLALARRLNRYNETECNYGLTDRQQKNVDRLEKRVREMLPASIGVTFNGDPRGYAVKLHFPSKVYNTWGGESEGWGI